MYPLKGVPSLLHVVHVQAYFEWSSFSAIKRAIRVQSEAFSGYYLISIKMYLSHNTHIDVSTVLH